MISFIDKLLLKLDKIVSSAIELLDKTTIRIPPRNQGVIYIGNTNRWESTDEVLQAKLRNSYLEFYQLFQLLFIHAPSNRVKIIEESNSILIDIIEQKPRTAPPSINTAKRKFEDSINVFRQYVTSLRKEDSETILIPDTNSLIFHPDLTEYKKLINKESFTLLFTPTVLSELDRLKVFGRDEEFRKKVGSIIRRVKGFRNQGNLLDGVIAHKSILVKMLAKEPDFARSLSWLDKGNMDDKIIASALEVQVQNPSDYIILVTSDINLQNKAIVALLDFSDNDF